MLNQELMVSKHLPDMDKLPVGCPIGMKMLAGMIYFILYKQVTGTTAGQERCALKFKCGAAPFKHIISGKLQKSSGMGKSDVKKQSSKQIAEQVTQHE